LKTPECPNFSSKEFRYWDHLSTSTDIGVFSFIKIQQRVALDDKKFHSGELHATTKRKRVLKIKPNAKSNRQFSLKKKKKKKKTRCTTTDTKFKSQSPIYLRCVNISPKSSID